jgi:hypothetical protein
MKEAPLGLPVKYKAGRTREFAWTCKENKKIPAVVENRSQVVHPPQAVTVVAQEQYNNKEPFV